MWKFASSLLGRITGISPLKTFWKFLFRRISDDFFDHEPVFDLKNGVVELDNLPLSTTKINSTFLASSPYVLHEGTVSKIRIVIPSISDLATKSVEVYLSGLYVTLKPNKQFEARFNEKIKQIQEYNKFYGGEEAVRENVSLGDEMDFFRELIKQILTNIKVTVENVAVRVFMNRPTEKNAPQKPQYFLMLRMPLCQVQKSQESQEPGNSMIGSKISEQVEKFKLEIPQISLHLLREDMNLSEYSNIPAKQSDFPFEYPPVSHPSTLVLIGCEGKKGQVTSSQLSVRRGLTASLRVRRNSKEKKIDNGINVKFPNMEVMVEGFQLQILMKFVEQLNDFQTLYSKAMQNLKQQDKTLYKLVSLEQSQDIDMRMLDADRRLSQSPSINLNASVDIFASIAFKREESSSNSRTSRRQSYTPTYLENMLHSEAAKELKKELKEFEENISQEDRHKMVENADTYFESQSDLKIDIELFCVYLLKYSSEHTDYERVWLGSFDKKPAKLHEGLPCGYFMLRVRNVVVENNPKSLEITLRKLELLDVNLVNNKLVVSLSEKKPQVVIPVEVKPSIKVASEEDLFQSFVQKEGEGGFIDNPLLRPMSSSLVRFVKKPEQHHCGNVLLRIAFNPPKPSRARQGFHFQKHNFYARKPEKVELNNKEILKRGLRIKLIAATDTPQSRVEIDLKTIFVMTDLVVARDLINILYPILSYRRMVEGISLKRQELLGAGSQVGSIVGQQHQQEHSAEYEMTEEQRKDQKQLYYSKYDNSLEQISKENELNSSNSKQSASSYINVEIGSIVMGVRSSDVGKGLIEKSRNKLDEYECFEHTDCFCQYKGSALVASVQQCQIKVTTKQRISLKSLKLNLVELEAARAHCPAVEQYPLLVIMENNEKAITRVCIESKSNSQIVSISIPKIIVPINEGPTIKVLGVVSSSIAHTNELLGFYKYIKEEFKRFDPPKNGHQLRKQGRSQISTTPKVVEIGLHLSILQVRLLENTVLLVKDIAVSVKPKMKAILISDVVLLHRNKHRLALHSFDAKDHTVKYYDSQTVDLSSMEMESNCPAEHIIFQIRNSQPLRLEKLTSSLDHRQYLKNVFGMNSSMTIKMYEKSSAEESRSRNQSNNLNRSQMVIGARLNKMRGLEPIQEQELGELVDTEVIEITTFAPAVIRLCSIMPIAEPLQGFVNKVTLCTSKFEELEEPKPPARRNSEQLVISKREINLKLYQLEVDLFPQFKQRSDTLTNILSNTRSVLIVKDPSFKISIGKQGSSESVRDPTSVVKGRMHTVEMWFLMFKDNEPEFNPAFIKSTDLAGHGFANLLTVTGLDLDLISKPISEKLAKTEIVVVIQEIVYESSAKAIHYMGHHFKHVAKGFGPPEQQPEKRQNAEPQILFELDDDEHSAQDLEEIQKDLRRHEQLKRREEEDFRSGHMEMIPKTEFLVGTALHLKMLEIKKLSATVFEGDEFDFLGPLGAEISQDVVVFLNDDNTFDSMEELEIEPKQDEAKKKPMLKRLSKCTRSTNVRLVLEDLCLEAQKYVLVDTKIEGELNLVAMLQIRTLNCLINKHQEEIFYLIKSSNKLILVVELEGPKIKVKFSEPRMTLGFTTSISFLSAELDAAELAYSKSFFGSPAEQVVKADQLERSLELYVLIPECTLTLNLHLKGLKMLSNQVMRIPELYFHNRICKYKEQENKKFIKGWITEVITRNFGSLLGNSVVTLISKTIELLMLMCKNLVFLPRTVLRFVRR